MNQANISSSFAATRVVPYDPDRVLIKLNTQLRTLTPPPTRLELEHWAPQTLHNITELVLQTQVIKSCLKRRRHINSSLGSIEATLD